MSNCQVNKKCMCEWKSIKRGEVFGEDRNDEDRMFGGWLMGNIDEIGGIRGMKHGNGEVVSGCSELVDFLRGIKRGDIRCYEGMVS